MQRIAIKPSTRGAVRCGAAPNSRRAVLLGGGLSLLSASQRSLSPANAETEAPESNSLQNSGQVSGITFTVVPREVTAQLRQRDDNLAWKCSGKNMFDCDDERAQKAEATMEEVRSMFKQSSK